ncbi:MAG: hypothetical protein J5J00_01735 [Deltaproteobacteria bacterium]|nr:hypothetical protein [Deltaproteobacteria bacterium]
MVQELWVVPSDPTLLVLLAGVTVTLIIVFSRIPLIIKGVLLACSAYTVGAVYAPEALGTFMGAWDQKAAVAVLAVSLLVLLISFLRFLKAGLIIGLWAIVCIIVGERAFPGIVQLDLSRLTANYQQGGELWALLKK